MKKSLIAALLLASFFVSATDGPADQVDSRGVITMPQDPSDVEPPPDPALQDMDTDFYCVEVQKLAEKIAELRQQGAPESYPVKILTDNGRSDLVWIARRVYWSKYTGVKPKKVAFMIWAACEDRVKNK